MEKIAAGRSRVYLAIIPIPLLIQIALPHAQPVHQYLTQEGCALLLKSRPGGIPELSSHVGTADLTAVGDGPWQRGLLTTGAWREDDEDLVYHYDILPGWNYALTSITHFWSADRGNTTENMIRLQIERPPLPPLSTDIGPFPTTFSKMMKFATGGWVLYYPRMITCRNTANGHLLEIAPVLTDGGRGIPLAYDTLTAFYAGKRLKLRPESLAPCVVLDLTAVQTVDLGSVAEIEVEEDVRNMIVWEVLGRMCHLLQDLSVPAHAHLDEHGLNPDSYEDYVGGAGEPFRAWSAENAGPGIFRPGQADEVIHYLMYTTQQRADHFGSNGPAGGNGNDVIGGEATDAERQDLESANLGSFGGPTTDAGPWSADQLNIIRDGTLAYAIRATAGLLHWFCTATGMIPSTGVPGSPPQLPATPALSQNYPNPFNPSTTISYRLPSAADVTLRVFDLMGREVALLEDGRKDAGIHTATFDAAGLASGPYFVRLRADLYRETRRVLLLR
jgi:hypothetical protein